MSLPISFYEDAFQVIQENNYQQASIEHSFQTNATLIDDNWCNFIKKHDIEIGVSIDGPEHIHDHARLDRRGRGTFNRAYNGILKLIEHNIPFSTIAVVTQYSLDFAEEIFKFFETNGICHIGFNFEELTGANLTSSIEANRDYEKCTNFIREILRLQRESEIRMSIREVTSMTQTMLLGKGRISTGTRAPFSVLSFDIDGNFSTFCPELLTMDDNSYGNFTYGNVNTSSIISLVENPKFQKIYAEIQEGISMCASSCSYFYVCGGGIPSNKYTENGTFASSETDLCRLKVKLLADCIADSLDVICRDIA